MKDCIFKKFFLGLYLDGYKYLLIAMLIYLLDLNVHDIWIHILIVLAENKIFSYLYLIIEK